MLHLHTKSFCAWHLLLPRSYRGYGLSEGRPSEAGLKLDAAAALQYVLSREDLATSKVVLFGRSLGGAVAIHLAAEHQSQVCVSGDRVARCHAAGVRVTVMGYGDGSW